MRFAASLPAMQRELGQAAQLLDASRAALAAAEHRPQRNLRQQATIMAEDLIREACSDLPSPSARRRPVGALP